MKRDALRTSNVVQAALAEDGLRAVGNESVLHALENSGIGVALTGADGSFMVVNRVFCEMTGYSESELKSRNWLSITHPEDRDSACDLARCIFTGAITDTVAEIRYRTKNGETIWVRNGFHTVRDGLRQPGKVIMLVEDISSTKRAEEAERKRIALELHDKTGQDLVSLVMALGSLRDVSGLDLASRTTLAESLDLAKRAADDIRTLSFLLYPPRLDHFGFVGALHGYARAFSDRSGIAVSVRLPDSMPHLPREASSALFHVVTQSLNNVWRHSGSAKADIGIRLARNRIFLSVRDFGREESRPAGHDAGTGVGIPGMIERMRRAGGDLNVEFAPGGTLVTASVPFPD